MRLVNKINLDQLKLKKGQKVLDIGCARGVQAMEIAQQGLEVYGIDPSPEYIKLFNKEINNKKVKCFPKVGSAKKLPYKDNFFDAFVSTEVFEHIPNVKPAMEESFRVLKKGGRGCISVPTGITEKLFIKMHPYWKKDSGHVNFFSQKELTTQLKQVGFTIEKIEKYNFEWTLFWVIHSLFKTRFDDTGTPIEHQNISEIYAKFWHYLTKLRLDRALLLVGNKLLPKSYYVYVIKTPTNE